MPAPPPIAVPAGPTPTGSPAIKVSMNPTTLGEVPASPHPHTPHLSGAFQLAGAKQLVAALEKELAQARTDLEGAEAEAAAWTRIDGTPRVNDATKNRHIKPHLEYWRNLVHSLKMRIRELETDVEGLKLVG